jgi:arginine repressor
VSVARWSTGDYANAAGPGAALNTLRRWAKENPQPTLRELCEHLRQYSGIESNLARLGKVLQRMGLARGRVRPRLTGPALEVIRGLAKQNPRATLDEFCQRVREHCGVSVSWATMSLTLQRLGMAKDKAGRSLMSPL